ncbi:hypothetical protein B0T18DRAFT_220980 [Schizothecium vesticola]|uniref:Uncharacterized protein n=1 Tax=Schizothecium vesticola TaxID=314040 RepID=A0AA40EKD9_9PEZI|nr:hypothetical protein B0T18DRAFT_220980 [Schizothecium vesticola]
MEDEKVFFLRGESGQSGDSFSVCCHKMAGQLFGSLATIEWKCSTPLKINDFTGFVTHAFSEKEPVRRLCPVAIYVGKNRHGRGHGRGQVLCRGPTGAHGRQTTGGLLPQRSPHSSRDQRRSLKLDCRRPSRTRRHPVPVIPLRRLSTVRRAAAAANTPVPISVSSASCGARNRGDGIGDGRTLQGTAKEWDRRAGPGRRVGD